jgi:hypothetical protein
MGELSLFSFLFYQELENWRIFSFSFFIIKNWRIGEFLSDSSSYCICHVACFCHFSLKFLLYQEL